MTKRYLILPAGSVDEGDQIVNCCLIELEQVQEDLEIAKTCLRNAKIPTGVRGDFCLAVCATFADVDYDQLERWGLNDGPSYHIAEVDDDVIESYSLRADSFYLRMGDGGYTYWEGMEHYSYIALSAGPLRTKEVHEILDMT